MKEFKKAALLAVIVALGAGGGYIWGQSRLVKANMVMDILEDGCIYSPGTSALAEGAATGIADSVGDIYTQYLDQQLMQSLSDMVTAAEQPGFGMEVVAVEQGLKVIDVGRLSPAEVAGIAPGDIITHANGSPVENTASLSGYNEGDMVEVQVLRSGNMRECRVKIECTPALPDVLSCDYDGVRYVRIRSFMQSDVVERFSEAISGCERLVIDLRSNPGGRLEAGLAIAEMFIPEGEQVLGFEYKKSEDEYFSYGGELVGKRMVILVDGYSASASEIVAGALQHYGYEVVGQTTYGKGLVQSIEEFDDGSGLKYTSAEYVLPGGEHINGKGVQPDIEVKNNEIHGEAPGWGLDFNDDLQLQQALKAVG